MTALDQALEKYIQDENEQAQYYDLVLNTDFYIPITEALDSPLEEQENVTPLIVETGGKPYLMLFDSEERLFSWAKKSINYVVITGYGIADLSTPELHWAINVGGQYSKELVPEEIGWLKENLQEQES